MIRKFLVVSPLGAHIWAGFQEGRGIWNVVIEVMVLGPSDKVLDLVV